MTGEKSLEMLTNYNKTKQKKLRKCVNNEKSVWKKCKLKNNKKMITQKQIFFWTKKIVKTYFHLNSELQEGNILFFDSGKVKKWKALEDKQNFWMEIKK